MDATTLEKFTRTAFVLVCLGRPDGLSSALPPDLHAQAAAVALDKKFPSTDLSFLVLDEQGQVIAQRWDDPQREVPIGSLTKPFLAVAYGRTHDSFPRYRCVGNQTCWLRRGHGTLGMRDAIAFSCNSYFHQLVAGAAPGFATSTLESLGLNARAWAQDSAHGNSEIEGEGEDEDRHGAGGRAAPMALVHAYFELTKRSRERAVAVVFQGMALSARQGTAAAVGVDLPHLPALAKTGTAPCTHRKKAPGDGFALVMAPADHPRVVLLVRVHGRPGAVAADVAAQMVAVIESQRPAR